MSILNRMSFMIETEEIKNPVFYDERDKWAFFISRKVLQGILLETFDLPYLKDAMELDTPNWNFQGCKIILVGKLKELEIYFGRRDDNANVLVKVS